jgi:hypothetical protein
MRVTNYELRITSYGLRITNYELRVTNLINKFNGITPISGNNLITEPQSHYGSKKSKDYSILFI